MGISSDGLLYFGFPVGEDGERPDWMEEDFEEFTDFLLNRAGIPNADYVKRREIEKACPVELLSYCSYDYPSFVLGIRDAKYRAGRGYTVELGEADLAVDQSRIDAAKAWCAANDIEWHEPKWLLCSMLG